MFNQIAKFFGNTNPKVIQPYALVVEDEELTSMIICQILKDHGYRVHAYKDGMDAINLTKNLDEDLVPNLIFIDLILPGASGFSVLKAFRSVKMWKGVSMFLMTGNTDSSNVLKGFDCGADAYLNKPLSREKVVNIIKSSERPIGKKIQL